MWTSSSSSSSSASRLISSSTSPYPYSTINSSSPRLPPAGKTMEEVWKDISLASDLPHQGHHQRAGVILQDFFSKDPAPPTAAISSPPPDHPPAPPTMLTLSSATHHFSSLLQPHHHHHQQQQHVTSLNMPFDAARKRLPEFQTSSGGDRRHKRMIKNRESAARSRARKQAYTNELELEVAHLLEENARLKEQQEQLCRAAAAQNQKRKPLHRTLTAPF